MAGMTPKKRKPGIPTGNAGEYFVMGELLRRGYDAQLADRNTKGYDVLIGQPDDKHLRKIQVKSVRAGGWYVRTKDFKGKMRNEITIYVRIGKEDARKPVRYFITANSDVASRLKQPPKWKFHAFMPQRAVKEREQLGASKKVCQRVQCARRPRAKNSTSVLDAVRRTALGPPRQLPTFGMASGALSDIGAQYAPL